MTILYDKVMILDRITEGLSKILHLPKKKIKHITQLEEYITIRDKMDLQFLLQDYFEIDDLDMTGWGSINDVVVDVASKVKLISEVE